MSCSPGSWEGSVDQRVLITAGGSGIGREMARAFAASEAKVCVCAIDEEALESGASEIPGLITKVCGVSKRADIERMRADSVESLGGVDVLVNNAGIAGPTASVEEMNPDAWERVMQVDLTGNAPQMTSPEAYIQFTKGLVTQDGDVTVDSTREFLRTYMAEFHDFVTRVRSALPKD